MSLQHGKGFTTDGEVDLQSKYNSLLSERNELKKEVERLKEAIGFFLSNDGNELHEDFRNLLYSHQVERIESLLKK